METGSIGPDCLLPLRFNPQSPYDCWGDFGRGGAGGEDAVAVAVESGSVLGYAKQFAALLELSSSSGWFSMSCVGQQRHARGMDCRMTMPAAWMHIDL
jgi:hypothetical protein